MCSISFVTHSLLLPLPTPSLYSLPLSSYPLPSFLLLPLPPPSLSSYSLSLPLPPTPSFLSLSLPPTPSFPSIPPSLFPLLPLPPPLPLSPPLSHTGEYSPRSIHSADYLFLPRWSRGCGLTDPSRRQLDGLSWTDTVHVRGGEKSGCGHARGGEKRVWLSRVSELRDHLFIVGMGAWLIFHL